MWIWPQVQSNLSLRTAFPFPTPHLEIIRSNIKVAKQDRRKKSKTKIKRPDFGISCLTLTSCLRPSR